MKDKDIWDDLDSTRRGESLHEEMFEFISAYADGECAPNERRLVQAFLEENESARHLLAELRAQSSLVASDQTKAPAWMAEQILAKTSRNRSFGWPRIAALAASGAAAALIISVLNKGEAPGPLAVEPDLIAQVVPPKMPALGDLPRITPAPNPRHAVETLSETRVEPRHASVPVTKLVRNSDKAAVRPPAGKKEAPVVIPKTDAAATYAYIDRTGSDRAEPAQIDAVANAGSRVQPVPATPSRQEDQPKILPDAAERLREKVKELSEINNDIKEAVGK
ncbi:MAG TPA: hypothetical protein VFG65_00410 [Fimbriimonadales bacterium]|jgi:anti-sigma factor RsiW|nr:hypothetical protein [Fimbriimonadales bacterium]